MSLTETSEKLARFNHHPHPAIDFCVEVEILEGMLYDLENNIGDVSLDKLSQRIYRATAFRVGGDLIAVSAKRILTRLHYRAEALMDQKTQPDKIFTWSPRWTCFHCNESFTNRSEAAEHFGLDFEETPACVAILTEGEKAIVANRQHWRERATKAEDKIENLEYQLFLEKSNYRPFGKAQNLVEALANWETIEGRMLAAEDTLSAIPRWLRKFFRARAERLGMKRLRENKKFRSSLGLP